MVASNKGLTPSVDRFVFSTAKCLYTASHSQKVNGDFFVKKKMIMNT